jgi:hypothetical protein
MHCLDLGKQSIFGLWFYSLVIEFYYCYGIRGAPSQARGGRRNFYSMTDKIYMTSNQQSNTIYGCIIGLLSRLDKR